VGEILAGIVAALAAGAIAKVGDVGGRVVLDAYEALRTLIISKLGKSGAVQSVEDDPRSSLTRAGLIEALAKADLADDPELNRLAKALVTAIRESSGNDSGDLVIGDIYAEVNTVVHDLSASGKIHIGNIQAKTGSAFVSGIHAGVDSTKKA
jgi:hypothetical protein